MKLGGLRVLSGFSQSGVRTKVMGSQPHNTTTTTSSDDEDGDAQWKAAIMDAASSYSCPPKPKPKPIPSSSPAIDDDDNSLQSQLPKHYQIKAQKALDDILEKCLILVKDSSPSNITAADDLVACNDAAGDSVVNGSGVRLFKRAPVGIVFDHRVELKGPTKKPRIVPGDEEVDEKSKKFKKKVRSVVVEGTEILAAANAALQKCEARLQAKEAAAKEAAKREEERVAQLKKIRGERWLPSMAKQMQIKPKAGIPDSKK